MCVEDVWHCLLRGAYVRTCVCACVQASSGKGQDEMKAAECASTDSGQLAVDQEQAGAKSIDPAMRGREGRTTLLGSGMLWWMARREQRLKPSRAQLRSASQNQRRRLHTGCACEGEE